VYTPLASARERGFVRGSEEKRGEMRREVRREVFAFAILFLTAYLLVSIYTSHPDDALLEGFWNSESRNAGGPLGALIASQIELWLGRSACYCLLAILSLWGLAILFRREIKEPFWKVTGAALFLMAVATFEVALSGSATHFDSLPGGYYGQFFYGFLFDHLERFGAYLMVFFALLVSLLISTDTLVYPALARTGEVVLDRDRWRSLGSAAEKTLRWLALFKAPAETFGRLREIWRDRASGGWAPVTTARPARGAVAGPSGRAPGENPADGSTKRFPAPRTSGEAPAARPSLPAGGGTESKPAVVEAEDDGEESLDEAELDGAASTEPEEVGGPVDAAPAVPRPPLKINMPVPPPPRPIPAASQAPQKLGNYRLPPLDLLTMPEPLVNDNDRTLLVETARKIEETLHNFKIEAQVVEVQKGPVITQYEVSLAAGIKVHKIMALSDDLAMALKAPSIRIVAPIPGKSTVGVEVPNRQRNMVGLRELLECVEFREGDHRIPLALGKDTAGRPIIGDLGQMPHLLIAGSTGSGKSVCINAVITNILLTKTPEEVKLILVDPKMVELSSFENLPHLLTPVVTDMHKAPAVLNWLVEKMDERYELLALAGVRNITSYNALGREKLNEALRASGQIEEEAIPEMPDILPHYVMVIDELADLMMTASKEVEASITRLSQKSRAVGIHIILATQRPSVDVITGLIKANMPSRISFHVASKVDSRTILDRNGADKLLGKGDLLYLAPGTSNVVRAQGTFISDREIREVVRFVRNEAEPQFNPELTRFDAAGAAEGSDEDELYEQAVRIVLDSQRGSVTLLQRQLQIGYTRASRLMEIMHQNGLVGPFKGSKAREVYYKLEDWEAAKEKAAAAGARERNATTDGERAGGSESDPED